MRAKEYLSEKAVKHLAGIDLSVQAEELRNTHENIMEDLPYWIMRFTPSHFSSLLYAVHSLGVSAYTNGALFNTKKTNAQYREAYRELVEKNAFILSRELACSMNSFSVTHLRVPREEAYAMSIATRKLIHKVWLKSSWEGETYGEDLHGFLDEAQLEIPKMKTVAIRYFLDRDSPKQARTFAQKGSGMYHAPKRLPDGNLVNSIYHKHSELNILNIGIGRFKIREEGVPAFNLDAKDDMYIVAQTAKDGYKYLIGFPDIGVLGLREKLKVVTWGLHSLCNGNGNMIFVLEGKTYEGELVLNCYGHTPFIHPNVHRE